MKPDTTTARVVVLGLFALTAYLLYLVFKPFLVGIAWGTFLATAFYPLHTRIAKRFPRRPWLTSALSALVVAALITGPFIYLIGSLIGGIAAVVPAIESYVTEIQAGGRPEVPFLTELEQIMSRFVDPSHVDLQTSVLDAAKSIGEWLLNNLKPLAQNIVGTIAQFLVALAVTGYLFLNGPRYMILARDLLPLPEKDREDVIRGLHDVAQAVFYGVMLTAAIQGVLGGLGWWIVGLPSPVVFGVAMFFFALLPAGTVVIWGPGAIWLFMQGSPGKALLLAVWGALVVSGIDNIIKPIFIGGRTRLNTLMVFFGIVGGMVAFGFTGLFLGPMVITLFLSLVDVIRREWQHPGAPKAPA